jgi:hypothetical protein
MVFWIIAEAQTQAGTRRATGCERFGPYPTREQAEAALRVLASRYRQQTVRRLRLVADPS